MKFFHTIGTKTKGFMAKMLTRYKLSNKEPPFRYCVFKQNNF